MSTRTFKPRAAAALIVLRPWTVIGLLLALLLSLVDGYGWIIGLGGGLALGTIDLLWTSVYLGRRRIEVDEHCVRVLWGRFMIAKVSRSLVSGVHVVPWSAGLLTYFVPAYHPFATVRLVGTHVQFDFMLWTAEQADELERRLGSCLQLN